MCVALRIMNEIDQRRVKYELQNQKGNNSSNKSNSKGLDAQATCHSLELRDRRVWRINFGRLRSSRLS